MNFTDAMNIVYPVTKKEELVNTICSKWDNIKTACYYSEFHRCNPYEQGGCLFFETKATYHS
jgi:hypothetical protein